MKSIYNKIKHITYEDIRDPIDAQVRAEILFDVRIFDIYNKLWEPIADGILAFIIYKDIYNEINK